MQSVSPLSFGFGFFILALSEQLPCFGQHAHRFFRARILDVFEQFVWIIFEESPGAARVFGALSHLFRLVQIVAGVQVAAQFEQVMRIRGQSRGHRFAALVRAVDLLSRDELILFGWRHIPLTLTSIFSRLGVVLGAFEGHTDAGQLHVLQDGFRAVAPREPDRPGGFFCFMS